MIIATDFDYTLHYEGYPHLGNPNIPLIVWLKDQRKQGNEIILWTCREGEELMDAIEYCSKYGLEFDAINTNVSSIDFVSRKVVADVYIDDKAINAFDSKAPWNNNNK